MLNVEQIQEWRGQDVVDRTGEHLGKLAEVYYDSATGEAEFASVKSGLLGRHSSLVPLAQASVGRDYVRVAFAADEVKQVDSADVDGVLDSDAVRTATIVYRLELPEGLVYESATLIARRRADAEDALRRADELEQEALRKAEDVKDAHQQADDATRRAEQAERDVAEAQEEAAAARADAERARRAAGPSAPE